VPRVRCLCAWHSPIANLIDQLGGRLSPAEITMLERLAGMDAPPRSGWSSSLDRRLAVRGAPRCAKWSCLANLHPWVSWDVNGPQLPHDESVQREHIKEVDEDLRRDKQADRIAKGRSTRPRWGIGNWSP
jgi:hypothetical protein